MRVLPSAVHTSAGLTLVFEPSVNNRTRSKRNPSTFFFMNRLDSKSVRKTASESSLKIDTTSTALE